MTEKLKNLTGFLKEKKILVAFSGGTDSTALLHILKSTADVNVTAVTVQGAHIPEIELNRAISFCKKFNIEHKIVKVDVLKIKELKESDIKRCYYCKTHIFTLLKEMAGKVNADIIADGTNLDDKGDYRPGMQALKELDIFSPFLYFKIGKKEIFDYLKEQNLDEYIQPSNACLISRINYGTEVSEELLYKIDEFEDSLRRLGFRQVRARIHTNLLRIEIEEDKFKDFFIHLDEIKSKAELLGKKFVTLDLQGYRTGSMNTN